MVKLKTGFRPEFNEAYQKVQAWFFSFPSRQPTLSELSKGLGLSKATANRMVSRLVEEGFLQKEVIGRSWRLSWNKQGNQFYKKIAFNLGGVYKAGLVDEVRRHVPNARAIILFGSFRKGDDEERSDLDLGAEVLGDKELQVLDLGVLPQFGYRTGVPVHLHIFSRDKIDLNLFANLANGIILDGFLEVKS